jgi:hypothetical protein
VECSLIKTLAIENDERTLIAWRLRAKYARSVSAVRQKPFSKKVGLAANPPAQDEYSAGD